MAMHGVFTLLLGSDPEQQSTCCVHARVMKEVFLHTPVLRHDSCQQTEQQGRQPANSQLAFAKTQTLARLEPRGSSFHHMWVEGTTIVVKRIAGIGKQPPNLYRAQPWALQGTHHIDGSHCLAASVL